VKSSPAASTATGISKPPLQVTLQGSLTRRS
jgi:hypothetical protein